MTREEYENKIKEKIFDIKSEFNNKLLELHKELLSEFKEEKPSLDGWNYGDVYYYIDDYGDVIKTYIICWNKGELYGIDKSRLISNNMFKTESEAKFKRERDTVIYELSKFAEPKDAVWNGIESHCLITWDFWEGGISVKSICTYKGNDIYFSTREDAEKAIQAVGEERIKRFYLGVE